MIDLVTSLMNQVNRECFDGKLKLNFPVRITSIREARGILNFGNKDKKFFVVDLELTKCIKWNLKDMRSCIAHELIHVYEIQILNTYPGHGNNFIKEMNRINKDPRYDVQVEAYNPLRKWAI